MSHASYSVSPAETQNLLFWRRSRPPFWRAPLTAKRLRVKDDKPFLPKTVISCRLLSPEFWLIKHNFPRSKRMVDALNPLGVQSLMSVTKCYEIPVLMVHKAWAKDFLGNRFMYRLIGLLCVWNILVYKNVLWKRSGKK